MELIGIDSTGRFKSWQDVFYEQMALGLVCFRANVFFISKFCISSLSISQHRNHVIEVPET